MARREFDAIKVKDQLGKPDNIGIFGPFKKTETLVGEEHPTVVLTQSVVDMAIWDNPNTTWDGTDEDDKWDTYSQAGQEIESVTNYDDEFVWRFTHGDTFNADDGYVTIGFTDTDNTTATEDTDEQEVTFTAGQVWQSKSMFKDSTESQVVSSCLFDVRGEGVFIIKVSADGGESWSDPLETNEYTFSNNDPSSEGLILGLAIPPLEFNAKRGSDLRMKIQEADGSTGKINLICMRYEK
jgi:hypothetical protein